jgi:hypothetical protein
MKVYYFFYYYYISRHALMHLFTVIIFAKAVQSKEGYFFRKKIYFLIYTVILDSTGFNPKINPVK